MRITARQRRARLGVRHRLTVKAATPEEAAASVVALHGTDPPTVFLSAGARLAAPGPGPVERALYDDRTLVRMTGMRRTVFVVPAGLVPVVHWSTMAPVARRERRSLLKTFAEGGWDETRVAAAEEAVLRALAEAGEADAAELGALVPELREQVKVAAGKPYEAMVSLGSRLLPLMAMDGRLVRGRRAAGTWVSGRHLWGLAAELPVLTPAEAQAELARRWLAAFGPGTEADFTWWTGWTRTDARKALAAAGAVEVELDEGPGLVLPGDLAETPEPESWAALLPALDPTPMGWQARDWYLPAGHRAALFDRNGNVGPTVWWDGRVVGGWAQRPDGEPVWRLLEDVGAEGRAAIEAEAAGLAAWLGGVRVTPRFRTPLERELSAP
ncbi:winged helix DNA-binding domain-containing protein [Actinomadura sp. ATCC 31491]|uniref:Winged helix DNA-binding domain-containing protein n=1 Tax=Actinomadura luzonensis TaxID=2805427 RepID=A0ABT0G840_9ACTN|nr:winged helix DNA-binding domain-containing protein [Actinomadura luzonensis]MCK2220765.1 winged helix DNA-binding domain-containing protein [Actinomadura luzonensis]